MLLMQDRENKVWYQYKNFYVSLNNSSFKMICQYFFPVLQDLVFAAVSVFLGFLHFSGIFAGGSNFIYFINQTVKTIHLFSLILCISRGTNFRGRIKKSKIRLRYLLNFLKNNRIHWLDRRIVRKQLDIMPTYYYVQNRGKLMMQSRENGQKLQFRHFFGDFEVKYLEIANFSTK